MSARRPFERKDGILRDKYESYRGAMTYEMPGSMLGETTEPSARVSRLEEVRAGHPDWHSAYALSDDRTADVLEALLAGLKRGNMASPMSLVPFADDPRVRPAILRAAKTADESGRLGNLLQVVGLLGGGGATSCLRKHVHRLVGEPRTFEPDPFFNGLAGDLLTASYGLLRLDPEATDAAAAMVRLIDHPNGWNRRRAVDDAVKLLDDFLRTAALELLRKKVLGLLDDADEQVFLAAAPVLVLFQRDRVFIRCRSSRPHCDTGPSAS